MSNGATVNHASDHRRAQEERQLWQSEKKIYSSPFEAEWAVLNHQSISPASAGNDRGLDDE